MSETKERTSFQGKPMEYDGAWFVLRRFDDGASWFPMEWTASGNKHDAIAKAREHMGGGMYDLCERDGAVAVVRCRIVPDGAEQGGEDGE